MQPYKIHPLDLLYRSASVLQVNVKSTGRTPNLRTQDDIQQDGYDHIVDYVAKTVLCGKKANFQCIKCDIALHNITTNNYNLSGLVQQHTCST